MLRVLNAETQAAHASRCSAQDQQHRSELQTLNEEHQAAIEALTEAHQAQLDEQRDALKAERSLQLQQTRQARRLLDDLQAERLHLKAMLERSLLPAGPGQVQP